MTERKAHCAWFKDNGRGRCIAACSQVLLGEYEVDCIGNTGKSMESLNHNEVRVSSGFIDGRGVAVDARGYKIKTIIEAPVEVVKPVIDKVSDSTDVHTDTNGWQYVWAFMPNGKKYKNYTKTFSQRQVYP